MDVQEVLTEQSPSGEVSTLITNVDLGSVVGHNRLAAFVEPAFVAFGLVLLQLPCVGEQSIVHQAVALHKICRI